tara:strand:- start:1591 stop:2283 length:693 start_codon:yes stop_codon:yes gene_type:complete
LNNISVIILAGGFGTRLKSVLDGRPKALADINGKPFIHLLVNNLKKQGLNNFIFSLHYKANQIIDFLEQDIFKEFNFEFIIEPNPLGTGGAVSYVINNTFLSDEFFVVNADTWLENGYQKLNSTKGNAILINKVENSSRYGSVMVNQNDLIIKFVEKNNLAKPAYINAGVYKLQKKLFEKWDGSPFSLEKDLFPKLVKKNSIKGIKTNSLFIDIGIPKDYYKFCDLISKR